MRHRAGKIGCGGWVLSHGDGGRLPRLARLEEPAAEVGGRPSFAFALAVGAPAPTLQIGDEVIVEVPGNTRVFLATTDASWVR